VKECRKLDHSEKDSSEGSDAGNECNVSLTQFRAWISAAWISGLGDLVYKKFEKAVHR